MSNPKNPIHPKTPKREGDRAFKSTIMVVPTVMEISLGIAQVESKTWTVYGKTRKDALNRAGVSA